MKRALLIMAKRPRPGRTKTRLCPPLTYQAAADLFHCFLQDMVETVRRVPGIARFLAVWPPHEREYFRQLAPDFEIVPQIGESLGRRLDHVMTLCSGLGFEQVVAINGDSPSLPGSYLDRAFTQLQQDAVDVVLGAADDGGYYLVGWKQPNARLIREVTMSTPFVLRDTKRIAVREKLNVAFTPSWYDVDGHADLARLHADLKSSPHIGLHTRAFLSRLVWEEDEIVGVMG